MPQTSEQQEHLQCHCSDPENNFTEPVVLVLTLEEIQAERTEGAPHSAGTAHWPYAQLAHVQAHVDGRSWRHCCRRLSAKPVSFSTSSFLRFSRTAACLQSDPAGPFPIPVRTGYSLASHVRASPKILRFLYRFHLGSFVAASVHAVLTVMFLTLHSRPRQCLPPRRRPGRPGRSPGGAEPGATGGGRRMSASGAAMVASWCCATAGCAPRPTTWHAWAWASGPSVGAQAGRAWPQTPRADPVPALAGGAVQWLLLRSRLHRPEGL